MELAGIERARERLAQADLAVLVFDRSRPWLAEDQALLDEQPEALVVHSKCDLPPAPGERPDGIALSALRGDGLGNLLTEISCRLVPSPLPPGAAVPFTEEQVASIRRL